MQGRTRLHSIVAVAVALSLLGQFLTIPIGALASQPSADVAFPGLALEALASEDSRASANTADASASSVADAPLAIARVQSSYQGGGTTMITYAITNNLPPTLLPNVEPTATYTDTLSILASYDPVADMNALRDVSLSTSLINGAVLLDVSGSPNISGGDLTWQLSDLAPLASTTVTLTVQTPAPSAGFSDLDTGAVAGAERWGKRVTTQARPASTVPSGLGAELTAPTSGADSTDADMLWAASAFVQDPIAAFEYVQGLAYDPYQGSIRGTRGTLWGQAGNSVDQASLLIAMLRSAGVPARYRHGTLSQGDAQALLATMFPPEGALAGYLPDGVQTADPISDPDLIAIASDHWWVEAYLPGQGWTDLDPAFPGAQAGDVYAAPGPNDRIAELPESLHVTIGFELEVEQYSEFPVGGVFLSSFTPLAATFRLSELAARPVTFGHVVDTLVQGGLAFATVTHTYTPYFDVGGQDFLTTGDDFQDLLTTFPLASRFTTAEWLTISVTDLNGATESFRRELKDLVGLDVRLNGGNPVLALPADNRPFTSLKDAFATWFLPNEVRASQFAQRFGVASTYAILSAAVEADALPPSSTTPEEQAAYGEFNLGYYLARNQRYAAAGLDFAELTDPATRDIEAYLRVKLFYDQPRIIITSSAEQSDGSTEQSLDLRSTAAQVIVYPGQARNADKTAQWIKGVAESYYEEEIGARLAGAFPLATGRIFDEMAAQGIEPVLVTPSTSYLLDLYLADTESYAYAQEALLEGKVILIPSSPVLVNGESTLGWWEVDPETGTAVGVLANGQHGALEYEIIIFLIGLWAALDAANAAGTAVRELWDCIARSVVPALQGNPGGGASCVDGWEPPNTGKPPWLPDVTKWGQSQRRLAMGRAAVGATGSWRFLPAYQCPVDNCGVEQFVLPYPGQAPIPLPEMLFGYNDRFGGELQSGRVITATSNGSGGAPAFSLSTSPSTGSALPGQIAGFDVTVDANFSGPINALVYAPEGLQVRFEDTGAATVAPRPGMPPGDYTLSLVAQSATDPDVIATTAYTLTVPDAGTLYLGWQAEPNISVPVGGARYEDVTNETNDGEPEFPDSAFVLSIANYSGREKTFTLSASGAPAGWLVLNGREQDATAITLGPNERTQVGLYVLPPLVPTPGTSFTINLQLSDGLGGVANASIPWTMPGQAHSYLELEPDTIYVGSSSTADLTLTLTNVGNASDAFPLTTAPLPISATVSSLVTPVSLAVDETAVQTATLTTDGVPLGTRFPVVFESPVPDGYTQYAIANVQIISDLTEDVFLAARSAESVCTAGEPGLSGALEALALAMVQLEASCDSGDCVQYYQDQVVSAASTAATYGGLVAPNLPGAVALQDAAQDLAGHTDSADILADLAAIRDAVVALEGEACDWSAYEPALGWTPTFDAALLGETAFYTFTVTNLGSLAATYDITVELPATTETTQVLLAPSQSQDLAYSLAPPSQGLYALEAEAAATGPDVTADVSARANAALNVVDRFVQLTAVTPAPAFVETGVSSTTVSIDVANVANVEQAATARLEIEGPVAQVYSQDVPVTILRGDPRSYPLTSVNTSGWQAGTYTLTVSLLDGGLDPIPDGSGYGYLLVGQALGASHSATPAVVAPGTVTVTTVITTEILAETVLDDDGGGINATAGRLSASADALATQLLGPSETGGRAPQGPVGPADITSLTAITRTEDLSPTITYSGTWATVENIFSSHTSDGRYTWSSTAGDSATFVFTGTWVHVGFAVNSESGRAEALIDGISQGIVELYYPDRLCYVASCLRSFAYDGLTDGPHTLEIVVTGTQHPNAEGTQVRLDYIDTWDGTAYPDGTFEEGDARVWRRDGVWGVVADAAASGGSFLNGPANTPSVWFPFTGDSVSLVGFDRFDGHSLSVYVDGVWQGDIVNYAGTPISRTTSFSGFGLGPHVMRVSAHRGEPNIDAFITPAVGPDYDPPVYTGLVRYEEDHPALRYNDWPLDERPRSWSPGSDAQVSEWGYMQSATISDTVSLDFYGSWLHIGLRTRNRGGLAEVSVDGVSLGAINAYSEGFDFRSYQFDLITGTHTVTITVLGQSDPANIYNQVYLDFIEVYDTSPVTDTFQNALKGQESGRVHVSPSTGDVTDPNAIQGDFLTTGLPNSNANAWYSFVGDAVTVYGLTVNNGGSAEVYIDGVLTDTISFDYPFSVQPRAFHYTGLGDGPHTVRVHSIDRMRIDGFASNQPEVGYQPVAEWWDDTPAGNGAPFAGTFGIAGGMAAGDIDEDGVIEIVVPGDDLNYFGGLFVYRGDGGDTGDGDPIEWDHNFGGGSFRTWVSSPALGDLDGQPGAEIVVAAGDELWAFHADGSTYWVTDTASIFETLSSPAIANLDLDPEPEIVVNLGETLEVREHDGTLAWSLVYPARVNPPVLADLTGDGFLDILVTGWDANVTLYDYSLGTPSIAWTQVLSSSLAGTFGAPAVADIDGQQPGGDPGPEVAVASNGRLTVLNGEDGSLVWSTTLDPGNPGGVSIADLDGDDEVEIVTGMRHEFETGRFGKIYALNADGTLLWSAIAEDSSSANNASVLDLNGDGVYEVAWNGRETGFAIFSGLDGSILFNEPLANSFTGTDYPIFADVDGDGAAEVVVAALRGLRVFGFDGVWGDARPLWNQHSYHITNVNDDLSVPTAELASWQSHNTYRTQTPFHTVLPVYDVTVTHTVGIDGVAVLTDTFSTAPDLEAGPVYRWDYTQTWADSVITRSFVSELTDLQPGESRQVAQGTEIVYDLPSGTDLLTLPPLYVSVPHIIEVTPTSQTTGGGGVVVYDVTLSNPSPTTGVYTPTVVGLPADWVAHPATVQVPAGGDATIAVTATAVAGVDPQVFDFSVAVTTDDGGEDQASASLTVIDAVDVTITAVDDSGAVPLGETAAYTLTIMNNEAVARTYDLTVTGLASVSLPLTLDVPAGGTVALRIEVSGQVPGPNPFTIVASASGGSDGATGVLNAEGTWAVAAALGSPVATGGPGASTVITVTVRNTGDQTDVYDLDVALPAGWYYSLTSGGYSVDSLGLSPGSFDAAELRLIVTPDSSASIGDYPIAVTATSQTQAGVEAAAAGTFSVGSRGVAVSIAPAAGPLDPRDPATWDVTITNEGGIADAYDLAVSGPLSAFASLAASTGALAPGQSQVVQLTVDQLEPVLPGSYDVAVTATSQGDGDIRGEDRTDVTIAGYEDVAVAWLPATQTVTNTFSASYLLAITNTGTLETAFLLSAGGAQLQVVLPLTSLTLPSGSTANLLVSVQATAAGSYQLAATVTSAQASAGDSAGLTIVLDNQPPVADAGVDQNVNTGAQVTLDGSGSSDPDGDLPLTYGWAQAGGSPVTLSDATAAMPTFTAPTNAAVLTFTLMVTDSLGLVDPTPDEIVVTVLPGEVGRIYLPTIVNNW